ncbi:hypothetical protein AGLY_000186 [Aphis glycines]|uniref:Uncharacterized protein n=1 Tax=Aphis glycines TaxID=307491 RepID=A0A6G0U6E3_APHGL|nr:hypothetical protein AGLY_000186 [Aphis glycines]
MFFVLIDYTLLNSQIVENKLKKEKTEKIVDNSRHKKRKKRSKNNQQQFFKTDKISEINLKPTDLSEKYCDRVNQTVCKDKREFKKPGLQNKDDNVNFEKVDSDLRKSKKSHNLIDEKPSSSTGLRKPYVFKNRIVERSKNYNFMCNSNLPKNHNCTEFRNKQDHKKNYQNNCQLDNEKSSNDQRDNSIRVVTPSNDNDNVEKCSNSIFFITQNEKPLYDRNDNCNDIKTMFINKGTKSQNCQYTNNSIENYKMQNFNDYHDIHKWDFHSHNGQNTYSIIKAENSKRNKHIKNIKPTTESLDKNEYEKNLVYIGSEYTDQEIGKNQKLNSDVMDINSNPLSNSTFINIINQQNITNKIKTSTLSLCSNELFVGLSVILNFNSPSGAYMNVTLKLAFLNRQIFFLDTFLDHVRMATKHMDEYNLMTVSTIFQISTSKSKMFTQTCNIQNYSETINNDSGTFYDQNKQEEDKDKPSKYYLKCEEIINKYSDENLNWTKKINLDKNKEQQLIKYYNNESDENNYNDIQSIRINNLENFTTYFDKIYLRQVYHFYLVKFLVFLDIQRQYVSSFRIRFICQNSLNQRQFAFIHRLRFILQSQHCIVNSVEGKYRQNGYLSSNKATLRRAYFAALIIFCGSEFFGNLVLHLMPHDQYTPKPIYEFHYQSQLAFQNFRFSFLASCTEKYYKMNNYNSYMRRSIFST